MDKFDAMAGNLYDELDAHEFDGDEDDATLKAWAIEKMGAALRAAATPPEGCVQAREADMKELINACAYLGRNTADAGEQVHIPKKAWFRLNDAVATLRKNCVVPALAAKENRNG